MPIELAHWIVWAAYTYIGLGVVLLPWWHWRGLRHLDLAAADGPWGFRVLISPGLVALWPSLLARATHARGRPLVERNAHRVRAIAGDGGTDRSR